MTKNPYKHLGIPDHKTNLLLFRNVYQLDKSYHNFYILFTYDIKLKHYTSEFTNKYITSNTYLKRVREHFAYYYGLRFGRQLKTFIRKALKGIN